MKFIWNIYELQGNTVLWWSIFNFLEINSTGKIYNPLWENEKKNGIRKWKISWTFFLLPRNKWYRWNVFHFKEMKSNRWRNKENFSIFFTLYRQHIFQILYLIFFSIWNRCKSFKFFPFHRNKMDLLTIFHFLEIETKR